MRIWCLWRSMTPLKWNGLAQIVSLIQRFQLGTTIPRGSRGDREWPPPLACSKAGTIRLYDDDMIYHVAVPVLYCQG